MITTAQLAANQANARLSAGPVTPEGKARSSQNSLRHGLTAKNPLLPSEDPEAYQKHCEGFFRRFAHRDEIERQLIQQLADIQWRLARVPIIEAALLDDFDMKGLATISIYEQRLLRTFEKTLAVLRKLQASESKEEIRNGIVCSTPPPAQKICFQCCTYSESGRLCETCGSRNLITEHEFDLLTSTPSPEMTAAA